MFRRSPNYKIVTKNCIVCGAVMTGPLGKLTVCSDVCKVERLRRRYRDCDKEKLRAYKLSRIDRINELRRKRRKNDRNGKDRENALRRERRKQYPEKFREQNRRSTIRRRIKVKAILCALKELGIEL
jgi:hypothetical protein